jgi:amino-acid N-acetyltransferase
VSEKTRRVTLRKPIVQDVPHMARIINSYASQGQMLPRSHHKLYQDIRDFVIATVDDEIIGCGALHVVWADIAEVRSLAVMPDWQGKGVGRLIVEALVQEARSLGLPSVFALTYRQGFFERMGFHVVPRETLPHKIWGECLDCPNFPNCNEIALTMDITLQEEPTDEG